MSSGATHAKFSLAISAGFSVAAMIYLEPMFLECTLGALTGILISPDLDLSNGGIVGGKLIKKKVGWVGKALWEKFWNGYSSSFKHGTWGSHSVPFGTFIRLAYIYYWIIFVPHFLIFFLFSPSWSLMFVLSWYAKIIFSPMFFCGLVSSDLIHIVLDKLTKESK